MERDDLIVNDSYALNAHHSEEEGVKIRKKIWKVTAILTLVTVIEVIIGGTIKKEPGMTWNLIILLFIALTIVKAGYIVLVFMHLGDERKSFRYTVLAPYIFFVLYATLLITIIEGDYQGVIQILP